MWAHAKRYANLVDTYTIGLLQYFQAFDKVRVALFVTWVWALFGLYMTKIFEGFFKLLLKLPDSVIPSTDTSKLNVKVINASDGKKDITNKFKLFLKYYWEQDEDGGGFSFDSLTRLLNCSMLYCSYLLTDKSGDVDPNKFWQNVNRFLVSFEDGACVKYNAEKDKVEVPFNIVRFKNDSSAKAQKNNDRAALMEFLNKHAEAERFEATVA
jgi:hypothetical protein